MASFLVSSSQEAFSLKEIAGLRGRGGCFRGINLFVDFSPAFVATQYRQGCIYKVLFFALQGSGCTDVVRTLLNVKTTQKFVGLRNYIYIYVYISPQISS